MPTKPWEINLARRLAWITLIGGCVSWAIRQSRVGVIPDTLNIYLGVFFLTLGVLLYLKNRHRFIILALIVNMLVVGAWTSLNAIQPRPGPLLVILTAITIAAAYFGFRAALTLTLLGSLGLFGLGYRAAQTHADTAIHLPQGMTLMASWTSTVVGFMTMSTIIAALVSYAVGELKKSLAAAETLLKKTREQNEILEEKERILKLFTELSTDYVYQINLAKPNMMPEVMAGSFERITGFTLGELERKGGWLAVVHPEDKTLIERQLPRLIEGESTVTEYRIISSSGKTIWLKDHVRPVRDAKTGAVTMFLGAVHDVTERRLAEEQIENLAFYDPLTSLPNRRLLLDRLEQALALSQRTGLRGALLFIDLDHFKNLNDVKGHEAGDQLLIQQARRLALCVREGDTVARLGGDEFIIVLGELAQGIEAAAEEATEITQRILHALSLPVALSYRAIADYENTSSIGIALFHGHECTVDELLGRADMAMYQAKADGRNTFRFFDPTMQQLLTERLSLEDDLKHALAEGQFQLYLQPQILGSEVIGAEVLLRWQHPVKGMVSPAEFIPVAEHTGVIVEIGNWVMEGACNILSIWAENPQTNSLSLAVNVSARQFRQGDFVRTVGSILARSGVDARKLKLELTESLALENIGDTVERMHTLRQLGVGLSLDDFGTGQSSLSYLKRLPLTQLKVDQAFVRDITRDPNDAILVQTIIGMARNLKLDIIAEGVETTEQRDFLLKNDCHAFQGYLFGKPVHWSTFESAFLKVNV